ncbi:MAG: hypothetical protein JHD05_07740 [Thermoleophilia bacterium]|nr:hypothetical protein [Thermoleophilia bacterium]
MDSDHSQQPLHERAWEFAQKHALWIQIVIGIIAWIAIALAFPLSSTTPIYARY